MLRVICVNVGKKYGPEWVYRLKRMVNQNLKYNQFVCMTDRVIHGVQTVPAPEFPGWWAKVGLFEEGKFPGLNLYLDLDVVITDSIQPMVDEFLSNPEKVWIRDDFSYSLVSPKEGIGDHMRKTLGGKGTINSSVMMWRGGAGRAVWDDFTPSKMDEVHGDQNWITQALWPDGISLIPNKYICSYKYHVQRGEETAPIVVFHGNPKVTELVKGDPLRVIWDTDSLLA